MEGLAYCFKIRVNFNKITAILNRDIMFHQDWTRVIMLLIRNN